MTLNFNNDTAEMFGKRIKLLCTMSGHYHVHISRPPPDRGKLQHILFLNNIDKKGKVEKLKIAAKLHKQFSHPSAKRLCDLVKSAGLKDAEFIDILMKLPLTCQTCIRYKKPAPRPVVGFPLGTHFNQTVAMDIKEIKRHKVLHLVDHATRYSVAVRQVLISLLLSSNTGLHILVLQEPFLLIMAGNLTTNSFETWLKT